MGKVNELMFEKLDIEVTFVDDLDHAFEVMETNPPYMFDCCIALPNNQKYNNEREWADFSSYICQAPYRIPLLAAYYDAEHHVNTPQEFWHGILSRPQDENALATDLFQWRLTATTWRKVAIAMELISEGQIDGSKGEHNDEHHSKKKSESFKDGVDARKSGNFFGSNLFSLQGRDLQVSPRNGGTNSQVVPTNGEDQEYEFNEKYLDDGDDFSLTSSPQRSPVRRKSNLHIDTNTRRNSVGLASPILHSRPSGLLAMNSPSGNSFTQTRDSFEIRQNNRSPRGRVREYDNDSGNQRRTRSSSPSARRVRYQDLEQ